MEPFLKEPLYNARATFSNFIFICYVRLNVMHLKIQSGICPCWEITILLGQLQIKLINITVNNSYKAFIKVLLMLSKKGQIMRTLFAGCGSRSFMFVYLIMNSSLSSSLVDHLVKSLDPHQIHNVSHAAMHIAVYTSTRS